MPVESASPTELEAALRRRVLELEASLTAATEALMTTAATLSSTSAELQSVRAERDKLRRAYEQLKEQLELLRRRIFIAKAERIDTSAAGDRVRRDEGEARKDGHRARRWRQRARYGSQQRRIDDGPRRLGAPQAREDPKGSGRRNLRELDLPEERVEIFDPALEGQGRGHRLRGEVSLASPRRCRAHRRGARDVQEGDGRRADGEIVTAKKPKEVFERGMLAPSMIAHVLAQKYRWGMPFHRLALELASEGFALDDGTMCRYAEHVGATLGCIVDAMAKEAKEKAFCLSTDATGVCIQPESPRRRQAASVRKGHFFVVLADQDHVFFEYQAKHTSDAVCEMFRGFSGYIQADAHAIYDALFRGEARSTRATSLPMRSPVGRTPGENPGRRPSATKEPAAREALLRIRGLFELEEEWADLAPAQRHARRQRVSRPMLDDFFAWAEGASRACAARAACSPPRSATPSGNETRCAASSTTAGCP